MSQRRQTLRALVSERLTAAAEEIFALVERTIAEYEEELSRSKEENQRRQQLLDSLQNPLHCKDVHVPLLREDPLSGELDQDEPLSRQREAEHFDFPDLLVKHEDDANGSSLFASAIRCHDALDSQRFKSETVEHIDISSDSDGASALRLDTEENGECYNLREDGNHHTGTRANQGLAEPGLGESALAEQDKTQSHECLACGETFADDTLLHRHMAFHVGGKPFTCPVCGKEFTRKNDYKLHLTVHTGHAPFKCPECDACFALKSHLESHMKGHRAAPLSCPVCHKSFTRKYRLHSHMAAHTGERPFNCPVCGRGFTRKDNLGTHMAMHNGKPFICAVCNRCFIRKDRLTAHMASHGAADMAPHT